MKGKAGIYPGLARYFATKKELADAGCMCRQRLDDCLNGKKSFTDQEQKAIARAALVKLYTHDLRFVGLYDSEKLYRALDGQFDEMFKVKQGEEVW